MDNTILQFVFMELITRILLGLSITLLVSVIILDVLKNKFNIGPGVRLTREEIQRAKENNNV